MIPSAGNIESAKAMLAVMGEKEREDLLGEFHEVYLQASADMDEGYLVAICTGRVINSEGGKL